MGVVIGKIKCSNAHLASKFEDKNKEIKFKAKKNKND